MKLFLALIYLLSCIPSRAEDGYRLWLRYNRISNSVLLHSYRTSVMHPYVSGGSKTLEAASNELSEGLSGLLDTLVNCNSKNSEEARLICGTPGQSAMISQLSAELKLAEAGNEGFIISTRQIGNKKKIIIAANTDIGILYGVFQFLRLLQTNQPIDHLNIVSVPKLKLRMLDHWDNLNRTVERGYAGSSIWDWHKLPVYMDKRYKDYARANASVGINAVVLNNVNANATVLTRSYLEKVKALADLFRSYGIRVFLSARFSAPAELGGLKTADPLDAQVQQWWKDKAREIYSLIPDFGGFLVKANSEGQPGPQTYGRSHADGANMLAAAVAPFRGIILWRAFVYSNDNPEDRHKQAYSEFVPMDGKFDANVMVQVKNGAIDFQPREPFHPIFGAMPKTPLMIEFQLTQEYLGQATSLVYLAPLIKECLSADTYSNGQGSIVAKIISGNMDHHALNGMAGVSNIGNDMNWCGHPFAQANWYAFGRLAWDDQVSGEDIAHEWLRMTFTNDNDFLKSITEMMMQSRETLVMYMTPIGLHHIMATGHHYGPGPWVSNLSRPEWNPVYYHRADSMGIGFNRTASGSGALYQYFQGARKLWEDSTTCEEKNILWFHHLSWNHTMKSGRTLWNELCFQYYTGAERVKQMQRTWSNMKSKIDADRFEEVSMLLEIQYQEAVWWRNACLLYFQTFSRQPIPPEYHQPEKSLDYYKSLHFPFAPGWGQ